MKRFWITQFSIKFYALFILISLLGNLIINYNSLCVYTVICILFYISTFVIGTICGEGLQVVKFGKLHISPDKLTRNLLYLSIIAVLLGWFYLIRYYGDLSSIFLHAFDIREETIGDGIQIVPIFITYPGSLVYSAFAITIALYHYKRERKLLYRAILLGIVIVLTDLQAFGRIGILFGIFMIGAYCILFIKKIKFRKLFIPSSFLLLILMLPRWIRGGSSFEGIGDRYSKFTTFVVPEMLAPFLSIFAYYFSGIYALNELLIKDVAEYAYGQRNFASIINFLSRILSDGSTQNRIVIIGDFVYVPFDTNIFTIIGELYMDFGLLGILTVPFFFGIVIGYLFKYKGIYADSIKIILLAWLFYTPIYNAFSFGGFLISFLFTAFLVLGTDSNLPINSKNDGFYCNSKL